MSDIKETLTSEVIRRYRVTIPVGENWVAYKNPECSAAEPSLRENRFNPSGRAAFYVASGEEVARREIPDYAQYKRFHIRPGPLTVFDLPRFAGDFGLADEFLKSRREGGYGICQDVAEVVTSSDLTISGVIYESYAMHADGEQGLCLAVLPSDSKPVGERFFWPIDDDEQER